MTTTLKAALYARYSTDKQRETSIDDQLRAARARAEREGWAIVATYTDEEVSGSMPVALRPGGKALMAGILAMRFDVLIVEGLDRLSREIGEQEALVKRAEHRGIRIIGTADGYDTQAKGRKVMRIARGLVNELYLDDLRAKTHRGLAGQLERGFSAGGKAYGYTTEAVPGGKRIVIDESQAQHVRAIFAQFADGHSVREIVRRLNDQGVPGPRGGTWAVSALQGSVERGLGLLHNELYIGRLIWNRRQWLKCPDTGARRYIERPAHEWQAREEPHLRIVDQATWLRTRERITRRAAGADLAAPGHKGGRPARTLFGGLLRCPSCGGAVVAANAWGYGCATFKDRGETVCTNSAVVPRAALDKRLLAIVREQLLDPSAIAELQQQVRQIVSSMRSDTARSERGDRARLAELGKEIGNLVASIAVVGISPAIAARLKAAEAEKATLESKLASSAPETAVTLVDNVIGRYKRLLMDLGAALEVESDREHTRRLLSDLLGPIVVGRDEEGPYAEMTEPAEQLLVAAGGGFVDNRGCGGPIQRLATRKIRY